MNAESLERREKALDHEIKQWKAGEAHRTAIISKLEAQIEVLSPKVNQLKAEITEAKSLYDRLLTRDGDYMERINRAKSELEKLTSQIEQLEETEEAVSQDIEATKAGKQAGVDAFVANAWAKSQQQIADYEKQTAEAQKELDRLWKRVSDKRKLAQQATDEAQSAHLTADKAVKDAQQVLDQASAKTRAIRDENDHLVAKNATLKGVRDSLTDENRRLEKANKDFVAYEKRALQLLDAKDQELLSREKTLTQKEQFKPTAATFLPQREG